MSDAKKTKQKIDQSIRGSVDQKEMEIEDLKNKLQETEGNWKRALADYQNLERQTSEFQSRFAKLATQAFVQELVEPYDHLRLAVSHLKDKGLDMVMNQFTRVFEAEGLKEINPLDQKFDPTKMEAIDTKEGENDTVLEVVSPGYELNGIVVKHARVVVGKNK